MFRPSWAAIFLCAVTLSPAAAETVERSGPTYHVAACGGAAVAGHAQCHARIVTDSLGNSLVNRFTKKPRLNATALTVPAGLAPASLISAYNPAASASYPNLGTSSTTIAIIDAYGYKKAEADLAVYRAAFGLPPCTTANGCFIKLNQSGQAGPYPAQKLGWMRETALDLDMASAMCPNCKIMLIQAQTNSFADLAAAVNLAASFGARVITNSYGGGEQGSQPYASAYDHPGVAIIASTGDHGYKAGPLFPATTPTVTAVGGTSLLSANTARGWSETAWSGGGSGCSAVYAKPAWQAFIPSCPNRMEADVSAVADPNTGVAVYGPVLLSSSGWMVFGGTSVAAPLVGGLYAAGGAVPGPGGVYGGAAQFNDVTSGANGKCMTSFFCTALPGYDGPTGLGTPNGPGAF
jgi:subtilase family serine protease